MGRRRFTRGNEFPASMISFLNRFSSTIGIGDNVGAVLGSYTQDADAICRVIKELNQFPGDHMTTFRLSAIPSGCERINILRFLPKIPPPLDHYPRHSYIAGISGRNCAQPASHCPILWKPTRLDSIEDQSLPVMLLRIVLRIALPEFRSLAPPGVGIIRGWVQTSCVWKVSGLPTPLAKVDQGNNLIAHLSSTILRLPLYSQYPTRAYSTLRCLLVLVVLDAVFYLHSIFKK